MPVPGDALKAPVLVIDTPFHLRAEINPILRKSELREASNLITDLFESNPDAIQEAIQQKEEADGLNRVNFRSPETLTTENFGEFDRRDQKGSIITYEQRHMYDTPNVELDLGFKKGSIDEPDNMRTLTRINVVSETHPSRTHTVRRSIESEEGRVFAEQRTVQILDNATNEKIVVEAVHWMPLKEVQLYARNEWKISTRTEALVPEEGALVDHTQVDLIVDPDKRKIQVMPVHDFGTDTDFYPAADLVTKALWQVQIVAPVQGSFTVELGKFGNKTAPAEKPQYLPVEFMK